MIRIRGRPIYVNKSVCYINTKIIKEISNMKKLISILLIVSMMIASSVMPAGAYSFNNNGAATEKAAAYRLPSKSSDTVWWVDRGDKLEVIAQDNDFYLVLYPFNNTGKHVIAYVPVSAVNASNIPNANKVYINDAAIINKDSILYHNPSTDKLIGASSDQTQRTLLRKNESVKLLFEKDGFYCVQSSTDTGFVSIDAVSFISDKDEFIKDICEHNNIKRQLLSVERKATGERKYHNVVETYSAKCEDCGIPLDNEKVFIQESHIDGFDEDNICTYCNEAIVCEHYNIGDANETNVSELNEDNHTIDSKTYSYCKACGDEIVIIESSTSIEPHNFKGNICTDCGYQTCTHTKTYTVEKSSEFKSQYDDQCHLITDVVDVMCNKCDIIVESGKSVDNTEAHAFLGNTCTVCGYSKSFQTKSAWVITTGGSRLILRTEPSISSAEIYRIPQGSEVTAIGEPENGYTPIKYGSYRGYVSTQYISFTKPASSSTSFIWPVKGSGRVTCIYQGYKGHNGVDIGGNPAGTSMEIVASKAGTVSYVTTACSHDFAKSYNCGCAGGFGRYIKINHGDGTETIYAHLRSINVSVGQYVNQGQKIAMMGTTGWSSGVHLHFEVRVNGTPQNPQNYIKY